MKTDPNILVVENDDTSNDINKNDDSQTSPQNEPPIVEAAIEPDVLIATHFPSAADLEARPHARASNMESADDEDSLAPYGRNKDGTPAKKRGRKIASGDDLFQRLDSVTPAPPRKNASSTMPNAAAIAIDYRSLANTATGLWFGVPQMLFGEDWKPEPAEEPVVAKAFHDYLKAKNIVDIDPTLALCLVLGSYTIARVNKPTVKSRLQSMFGWMKAKTSGIKLGFNRG